jgi:hypothetical protein
VSLTIRSLSALAAVALAVLSACGGDSSPARGNGTNDVVLACKVRATWTRKAEKKCTDCRAAAPAPECECTIYGPFAARCEAQNNARVKEADCTKEVAECAIRCIDDCSCIDACYTNHPACRTAQSALDGCVADACDAECK